MENKDMKQVVTQYFRKDIVADFSQWPVHEKLSLFVHKVPKTWIEERKIGGKKVKYVPFKYPRKVLNFIFNFHVSNEAMHENYREYKEKFFDSTEKKWSERSVTEAEVTMKFTFKMGDQEIIRTVKSSHKQFENKALTKADAMKGAYSKAWTLVAATFGIGEDLDKDPDDSVEEEKQDTPPPPKKDFIDASSDENFGY